MQPAERASPYGSGSLGSRLGRHWKQNLSIGQQPGQVSASMGVFEDGQHPGWFRYNSLVMWLSFRGLKTESCCSEACTVPNLSICSDCSSHTAHSKKARSAPGFWEKLPNARERKNVPLRNSSVHSDKTVSSRLASLGRQHAVMGVLHHAT